MGNKGGCLTKKQLLFHTKKHSGYETDITYIITPLRTYYLCVVMDLCGRYIVAYRLGTEITATLVSDTVRDTFTREKGKVANGLVLHSDQGCQYTSEKYFALTQEYHFAASMSRRGYPYDNALAVLHTNNACHKTNFIIWIFIVGE